MAQIDDVASATLRIEHGNSRGSGFQFIQPDIVVTNHHVVEGVGSAGSPSVFAVTENGDKVALDLLGYSPKSQHDYAIFRAKTAIPGTRYVLQPKPLRPANRGLRVLFGGFPHGIPHLLVHHASIAGRISDDVFYLEASVNGGNSGGPIVDEADGTVIGIVTQRRFLGGADLATLAKSADQLRQHNQAIAGRGSVEIMGVNFGAFNQLMAEGMLLVREVLEGNANTGIGIGFSITFVTQKAVDLKLL